MKNFILAPDSFKGTLSAIEVCDIMQNAILRHIPDATIHRLPMSDGGEGMVDAYLTTCGGKKVVTTVTGPLGNPVKAAYGILPNGTAVIEMAAAAGLPLAWDSADQSQINPMITTTLGVGELLAHAHMNGVKSIILGLGGSATCDGGIGLASSFGYRFLDTYGKDVPPTGAGMCTLARIEPPAKPPAIEVKAACDVDNPLFGPQGSAFVFGPQKGATPQQVVALDDGLRKLSDIIHRDLRMDVSVLPGAGAAGGLGACVAAFLHGSLQPGIEMLLDAAEYETLLQKADLVLTGEGQIDGQSIRGKAPVGVAQRAKLYGVPCIALCGSIGENAEAVYDYGIGAIFAALRKSALNFDMLKANSRGDLEQLCDAVIRTLILQTEFRS